MDEMDPKIEIELGAATFRRLVEHLQLSDAFATNASTSIYSRTPNRRAGSSKTGVSTTTRDGPHASLDELTPTEFATRPTKGHNQNGLYF